MGHFGRAKLKLVKLSPLSDGSLFGRAGLKPVCSHSTHVVSSMAILSHPVVHQPLSWLMPPTALWVASYPDGALRDRKAGRDTAQPLPRSGFLESQLNQVGGGGLARCLLYVKGGGAIVKNQAGLRARMGVDVQLRSLVRISSENGTVHENTLTNWSPECQLQREFHKMPLDAYSVHITSVQNLVSPELMKIARNVRQQRGNLGLTGVKLTIPLFIGHFGGAAGEILLTGSASWQWKRSGGQCESEGGDAILSSSSSALLDVDCEPGIATGMTGLTAAGSTSEGDGDTTHIQLAQSVLAAWGLRGPNLQCLERGLASFVLPKSSKKTAKRQNHNCICKSRNK